MMEMEKVYEQASAAIDELFAAADTLKRGDILVIGCSTSEIVGKRIGSGSSVEAAKAVMDAVLPKIKARDEKHRESPAGNPGRLPAVVRRKEVYRSCLFQTTRSV